jgi:hypothetical protein
MSAGAIGHALILSDGVYDPAALEWVAAGFALAWLGVFWPGLGPQEEKWAWGVCIAVLAWQMLQSFTGPPPVLKNLPQMYWTAALPLMAATALEATLLRRWARAACLATLVAVFFATGAWLLHRAGPPPIDVYVVTTDACVAMEQGRNPYAIDFPDIYADRPDWERAFYSPSYVYGGRVHFGYPYMPLSLLVALAGHWLGGDYRLGNLAVLAAAGALLGFARPTRFAAAAAGLLLLMPRDYRVIENGWAEPVVVACLALVVFCALRWPRGLPYAAGLLLASKQHMLLAAPALLLLMQAPGQWLRAAATATVVTLPIVLWNARAFWHSTIEVQLIDPFRYDSLNFAAWWVKRGGAPPPAWIAFGLALAVLWCAVRRGASDRGRFPRRTAAFAGATALGLLCLFALAKQAFENYYFAVIGTLCCGIAAEDRQI